MDAHSSQKDVAGKRQHASVLMNRIPHAPGVMTTSLKAEIGKGPKDIAEGRVKDFDTDRIVKQGKKLLRDRSRSA